MAMMSGSEEKHSKEQHSASSKGDKDAEEAVEAAGDTQTPKPTNASSGDADGSQQQQQQTSQGKEGGEKGDEVVVGTTTDEEGLLYEYDVILVGTGLVQSVLAAALARAGRSVLHCDGADYYGELDAVWTLPYLLEKYGIDNDNDDNATIGKHKQQDAHANETEDCEDIQNAIDGVLSECQKYGSSKDAAALSRSLSSAILLSRRGGTRGLRIHSAKRCDKNGSGTFTVGMQVSTPYGVGVVTSETNETYDDSNDDATVYTKYSIALNMDRNNFMNVTQGNNQGRDTRKNATTLYACVPSSTTNTSTTINNNSIVPLATIQTKAILETYSRSFALDMSPALLFADGLAVESLIKSKVSDYLEFKALEGMLLCTSSGSNDNVSTTSKRGSSTRNDKTNKESIAHNFMTVPCSKNSVFGCKDLSPLEKRRLVKFLQLALEYYHASLEAAAAAQQAEGDDGKKRNDDGTDAAAAASSVLSLNERHLQQGRSLARPQNKALSTNELKTLRDCIVENMPLQTYLQTKQNLSPNVIDLVRYAMMLETTAATMPQESSSLSASSTHRNSMTLEQGIKALCRHVHALGRYGTTAFLVPLYGNELSQAFCRCAAVYGATYLLRRNVIGLMTTNSAAARNDDSSSSKKNSVRSAFLEEVLETAPSSADTTSTQTTKRKQIQCKHVILPQQALLQRKPTMANESDSAQRQHRALRRICILRGKPTLIDDKEKDDTYSSHQQRHLVLFPPNSLLTTSLDDENEKCCGLTYHSVIQAVLFDEHVNVAPRVPCGCTVVHLTSTIEANPDAEPEIFESQLCIFDKAIDALIRGRPKDELQEIYHLDFSYELDDYCVNTSDDTSTCAEQDNVNGLHVIRRTEQPLVVDDAFEQAQRIFARICPGYEFLTLSSKLESDIQERLGSAALAGRGDDDDQDERVLSQAMELIQQQDPKEKPEE